LVKSLEDGNDMCAIFFDYCRAFDSVPHRPLIAKLRTPRLGVDDGIVNWVKNYLAERSQIVVVDGVESCPLSVL
jgi:hypothetical protein